MSKTQRDKKVDREEAEKLLWSEFKRTASPELKNRLVEHYLPQAKYAADRLASRLPAHADHDDLIQTGVFGLMEAIDRFDPGKGVRFETYCQQRITGSMLDGIRAADWVPRVVRATAQRLEKAWLELEGELGREPSDFEMAARLGIDLEEYDKLLQDSNVTSVISYNLSTSTEDGSRQRVEAIEDRAKPSPIDEAQRREILDTMTKALTKKERLVIILYYYERFTFKEIGEVLGVTESRVCQIHSKVIAKLKAKLARAQADLMAD